MKRRLCEKSDLVKQQLVQSVKCAISSDDLVAFTMDMCSDMRQRQYLGLTVHYVLEERLMGGVLSVREFQKEKKNW